MLGLFSKERSLERKYKKLKKRLNNMFAQSPDRRYTAQQLAELETEKAIIILLGRFERRTSNHTSDKEEKDEIAEMLVSLGAKVIEPTKEHLAKETTLKVNWPMRVLGQLLSRDGMTELIVTMLGTMETDYVRDPQRKEELILAAADYRSEALGNQLVRFLEDDNERIRFLTVDAIFKGEYAFAREGIMKLLADEDEESHRIINAILEGVVETDWTVKGFKSAVEGRLPEGYALTRAGTIRRRG